MVKDIDAPILAHVISLKGSRPDNFVTDINNLGKITGFTNFFAQEGSRGILAWTWDSTSGLEFLPGSGEESNGYERASDGNDLGYSAGGSYDDEDTAKWQRFRL